MTLAWDPTLRRAWQVGFGRDHHAHAGDGPCVVGCVPSSVDPLDDDMVDAELLHTIDASGTPIWRPTLTELRNIGARVLDLWIQMRDGLMARGEPWVWWRPRGNPTAHLYPAGPGGRPGSLARCGQDPDALRADEWVVDGDAHCRSCEAVVKRDAAPVRSWGTIGGVPVGTT